jgi:filamentous hemagglutinin
LYNRQLHPNEKKAIAETAGNDEAERNRLTRAACYAVKCWAEFAPGSVEYNKTHVSQLEASQLGPELDWVNRQQDAGLFNYTPGQKIGDMMKSDPLGVAKDVLKVGVGVATAKTGGLLCGTGLGCTVGAWMFAFGTSDAMEGATGLAHRYDGVASPGANPLRWGFNQLAPTWGNTIYDGINLGTSILALRAPVPLNIGKADGLNRPDTMFDVSVPNINNTKLIPFTKEAAPYGTHQGMLWLGVGSKGATVINDIRNAEERK